MRFVDNDRWAGAFELTRNGRHIYTIEAWTECSNSWRQEFIKKRDAGQDVHLEAGRRPRIDWRRHGRRRQGRKAALRVSRRIAAAPSTNGRAAAVRARPRHHGRCGERADLTTYFRELELFVDRPAARFAAWYEMFPRSQGTVPERAPRSTTASAGCPKCSEMGFDVLYFVPIHPIGRVNRKGREQHARSRVRTTPAALMPSARRKAAIPPSTRSSERSRISAAWSRRVREHGLEVALDFAIQCAPDHPWVKEHPDWFDFRA